MKYMIVDLEVENNNLNGRFASPFHPANYIVAPGWKVQGASRNRYKYFYDKETADAWELPIPDDVDLLVGFHFKFDMQWLWGMQSFQRFLKRGGKIFCTQTAEYLLGGMQKQYHMVSLDKIIERYGGKLKLKPNGESLWANDTKTSEINPDLLIDYLVGSKKEGRNGGDITNTELVYVGQLKRIRKLGMQVCMDRQMEAVLAACMMEMNGLHIDLEAAKRNRRALRLELGAVNVALKKELRKENFPPELEFKWSSPYHVSALLFGGAIKYRKRGPVRDASGAKQYKKATADWPLFDGEPISPEDPRIFFNKELKMWARRAHVVDVGELPDLQDRFQSGRQVGKPKFRKVPVQGELKTKWYERVHICRRKIEPYPEWKTDLTDCRSNPVYRTGKEIMDELKGHVKIGTLPKLVVLRSTIAKEIGTYYWSKDKKTGQKSGMLTLLHKNGLIHQKLNLTSTVTNRLSSSDPNGQNFPRSDEVKDDEGNQSALKRIKEMFSSRYGEDGVVIEIDYSQLEVVAQALLTGDRQLIKDLNDELDLHVVRLAAWKHKEYGEALAWAKDENHTDYKEGKKLRTATKIFSFRIAYGAGVPSIAAYLGLPADEVQALLDADKKRYPRVYKFFEKLEQELNQNGKYDTTAFSKLYNKVKKYRRAWWQAPSGLRYCWTSYDVTQLWRRERGIMDSFSSTQIKNYPVQGTAAELVKSIMGALARRFLATDNYGGKAVLINQVHDSFWADAHRDVAIQVAIDMKRIMQSIPQMCKYLWDWDCPVPFPAEVEFGLDLHNKSSVRKFIDKHGDLPDIQQFGTEGYPPWMET